MTRPIAQAEFDVRGQKDKMTLSIFEPELCSDKQAWGCKLVFSSPFNSSDTIFGENSLQALVLALKIASVKLYSSNLYLERKLGVFGEIGGQLVLPASKELLDVAPYPF